MKKKLIKFFTIPLTIFVICLFAVPAYLLAGPDDYMADAIDAPPTAEGDFDATDSNQGTTFSSFGNIAPNEGDDFVFMSTGCVYCNESGADDSTDWGGSWDEANLTVYNVTVPTGIEGFTFDLYYMSAEPFSDQYDKFEVELYGSSDVGDGTQIAYADFSNVSLENGDLEGTAFENQYASGGGTAGGPVDPGDLISIEFYITDTVDNAYDSAVILDNFQFTAGSVTPGVVWGTEFKQKKKKKKAPEPVVVVRTMSMTCANVWINEANNFEFVFLYEYANNNWVKIYDMVGVEVFSIDMPYGAASFEAALPDGMYTVMTFHEEGRILQKFTIGKP
ncbi:T9SS type A sorting domain-containing protein [Actinomycetota bacterium]